MGAPTLDGLLRRMADLHCARDLPGADVSLCEEVHDADLPRRRVRARLADGVALLDDLRLSLVSSSLRLPVLQSLHRGRALDLRHPRRADMRRGLGRSPSSARAGCGDRCARPARTKRIAAPPKKTTGPNTGSSAMSNTKFSPPGVNASTRTTTGTRIARTSEDDFVRLQFHGRQVRPSAGRGKRVESCELTGPLIPFCSAVVPVRHRNLALEAPP